MKVELANAKECFHVLKSHTSADRSGMHIAVYAGHCVRCKFSTTPAKLKVTKRGSLPHLTTLNNTAVTCLWLMNWSWNIWSTTCGIIVKRRLTIKAPRRIDWMLRAISRHRGRRQRNTSKIRVPGLPSVLIGWVELPFDSSKAQSSLQASSKN